MNNTTTDAEQKPRHSLLNQTDMDTDRSFEKAQ